MKWPTTISAIVAGMAFVAAAVSARPQVPRDRPMRTLKLKVVAPLASGVDGMYLSIQPDGEVGVDASSGAIPGTDGSDTAAQFSVSRGNCTGGGRNEHLYELHLMYVANHALALYGTPSLLFLRDFVDPAHVQAQGLGGLTLDWQSFKLSGFGDDGHGDGGIAGAGTPDLAGSNLPSLSANSLLYAGSKGRWVLIQEGPFSYVAAWYGATSIIAQNYILVDIVYVNA